MIFNAFRLIAILMNSILVFFTVAFILEGFLALFRITNQRLSATLRLIPFIFLILDRIFIDFNFVNWMNPLGCDTCIQKMLLNSFFPSLKEYLVAQNTSHMSYLTKDGSVLISNGLFFLFCSVTFFIFFQKVYRILVQSRLLKSIITTGTPGNGLVNNAKLDFELKKASVNLVVSDQVSIPLATHTRKIILPKNTVEDVTESELESIVAHELEHIIQKDSHARLSIELISAVFWWVPTLWWKEKMIENQEIACDQSVLKYGLDYETLASSLIKVAREAKSINAETLCFFSGKKNSSMVRLRAMLGFSTGSKKIMSICLTGILLEILLFLMCKG